MNFVVVYKGSSNPVKVVAHTVAVKVDGDAIEVAVEERAHVDGTQTYDFQNVSQVLDMLPYLRIGYAALLDMCIDTITNEGAIE